MVQYRHYEHFSNHIREHRFDFHLVELIGKYQNYKLFEKQG